MKVLAGNIVSRVVEVAAKSTARRPPPVTSLGPQNDRHCTARRSVSENFWSGVDRGWFTCIPGLLFGFGPGRIGGCLDKIMDTQSFLTASEKRERIGIRHEVHRMSPSVSVVSNHRLGFPDAFPKEGEHSFSIFIWLGEHKGDVRQDAVRVSVIVSNRR